MRIKYIRHNLKGLEVHINNIETYIYANLGLVDNYSLPNDELYKKSKIEIELLKQRLRDLQLNLK